jgi:hypothetical protein
MSGTFNVVTLQQTSWEGALNDRRLTLLIDTDGIVRRVGETKWRVPCNGSAHAGAQYLSHEITWYLC